MIIIDGSKTDLRIDNFANLEEILVEAVGDSRLSKRVVTDVLLNDETFSELYPHQAEDITSDEITSVEIRSVPLGEMALNIAQELFKVCDLMASGSRQVARFFRQADDDEALEMLQDMLDVSRNFMAMLGVLRSDFGLTRNVDFSAEVEAFSSLLGEMTEVLESEDWILLADLLEYEFAPMCENWKKVIQDLREGLRSVAQN